MQAATRESRTADAHAGGTLLRVLLAGLAGGLVFLAALGHRTDYVGHLLAGYGGTLGLLALPLLGSGRRLRWESLALALVAIAIGAVFEATLFRLAIFDPVDFVNQSLGALLAAAAVQDRPAALVSGLGVGALAFLFLMAGGFLAFA